MRPRTHVVLHSAAADGDMKRRAEALGLRLLDKMQVEQVVETLVDPERAKPPAFSIRNSKRPCWRP